MTSNLAPIVQFLKNSSQSQKNRAVSLFDVAINKLDLPKDKIETLTNSYNEVAKWLSEGNHEYLSGCHIYPQGSMRIGTVIRPVAQEQYDIDLILKMPKAARNHRVVLKVVQNRLEEHSVYKTKLTPLNRGFRLQFEEFHMDITPAIEHPVLCQGIIPSGNQHIEPNVNLVDAIEVTDKKFEWKDSNPVGFADWFLEISKLRPRRKFFDSILASATESRIDAVPDYTFKEPLQRIVQFFKLHRDQSVSRMDQTLIEKMPISILITALAAKAYREICETPVYIEHELDLLLEMIIRMKSFITFDPINGYRVMNPTVSDENFAEKWNRTEDGQLYVNAFNSWNEMIISDLNSLFSAQREDQYYEQLGYIVAKPIALELMQDETDKFNELRRVGELSYVPKHGLIDSSKININTNHTPIPKNQFYAPSGVRRE